MDLYIAPNGNDDWSGTRPTASASKTDGPLATLDGVRTCLRALKTADGVCDLKRPHNTERIHGPVTVHLRGGVYPITKPVVFTAEDSWPVTFTAYKKEKPVISGARRITGWKQTTVNDRKAWVANLPDPLPET